MDWTKRSMHKQAADGGSHMYVYVYVCMCMYVSIDAVREWDNNECSKRLVHRTKHTKPAQYMHYIRNAIPTKRVSAVINNNG